VHRELLQVWLAPPETSTLPDPLPFLAMVRSWFTILTKFAVTFLAPLILREQTPVPEHCPDQPTKSEPGAALAVSEIRVPEG
jgi:hypothetical protein